MMVAVYKKEDLKLVVTCTPKYLQKCHYGQQNYKNAILGNKISKMSL